MGFSSLIHAAGNVAAPLSEAAGGVLSLGGLAPNKAATDFTNIGHNISNQKMVASNVSGLFNPNVTAFAPAYQGSVPSPMQPAAGDGTGGGGGTQQNTGSYPTNNGSTTSAADQQALQNTLFGIDSGIAQGNDALGRLSGQLSTGNGNIDKQYQDAYNRLLGQQQIGDRNYTQNRNGQINEYGAKTSQNNTDAAQFLLNARHQLGANGAGGGSAARYALPFDAQTQATKANAGAQQNFTHNIVALDQGHQDDLNKFTNSQNDLQTQRDQGKNDLQTKINSQEADLQNQIAQLMGQKTIANGGNWQAAAAAANPYTARIQALLNSNDALAATPAIREQAVQLNAPNLSGYNWSKPVATPVAQQDPTLANPNLPVYTDPSQQAQDQGANPLLAMFGLNKDPNQLQYA